MNLTKLELVNLSDFDLKISEKRFRTLVEQSPLSIQIFSPEGLTTKVNKAWENLWRIKASQIIGKYNILKDKQLEELGIASYIKNGFKGVPVTIPTIKYVPEKTVPNLGAVSFRWVKAMMYPLKNNDGSIREIVLIHQDITENVLAEEALKVRVRQQEVISRLGLLALSGADVTVLMDKTVSETAKVLDLELVKILELLEGKEKLVIRAAFGLKKKYRVGKTEVAGARKSHCGFALLSKVPVIVTNLKSERRFKPSVILFDHNIISGVSVIIGKDKTYGALTVHSTKPRNFTKEDIDFIQSIANLLALAIERRDAQRFMTLYQERLGESQNAGHIGVFDWDMLSNSAWLSDVEEEIFGVSAKDMEKSAKGWGKNIHKDDIKRVNRQMKQAIKNKEEYSTEFRIVQNDQTSRWIRGKGRFYYDKTGRPVRMLGVNYDTTERKRLEDSLLLLARASEILSSSLDYETTLKNVARSIVPGFCDWCGIDILDEDGNPEQVAVAHKDPKKVVWAEKLRKLNPPDMTSKTGMPNVIKTGKAEFYPLITDEMLVAAAKDKRALEIGRKLNLTSVIITPVKVKGRTIGAITFVSAESRNRFIDNDLYVSEQLSSRVSLAIENALLYQDVNKEKERLKDLLTNVPGVVWESWGQPNLPDQKIDFVSNHVEKMLGYTVEEWLGTPNFWLKIVHPQDKERAAEEAAAIFVGARGGVSRFRWITKKGKILWIEAHSYVVKENGKPIGMRGVSMDISQRMEVERRKDEFISMASHELKTPLTSMKVFSHLLEKNSGNTQEGFNQYISRMNQQIDKLTNLVNDLLDISKIQAGKLELRRDLFSVSELIEQTVKDMRVITNENITARYVQDKKVYADKDRISQVLINLLTNAIKYSPPSSPIEVKAEFRSNKIIISVRDRGMGISKEHHGRIFDRFYRVYDSIDRTFPGLGMGLYISSEIIKRHDEKMWVASEKGKGSTFYFSLPVAGVN